MKKVLSIIAGIAFVIALLFSSHTVVNKNNEFAINPPIGGSPTPATATVAFGGITPDINPPIGG